MTRRKLTAIAILLLISLIGFCVPYDYTAACSKLAATELVVCFFRNASGVWSGRSVARGVEGEAELTFDGRSVIW